MRFRSDGEEFPLITAQLVETERNLDDPSAVIGPTNDRPLLLVLVDPFLDLRNE